jgi:hypothetical protein
VDFIKHHGRREGAILLLATTEVAANLFFIAWHAGGMSSIFIALTLLLIVLMGSVLFSYTSEGLKRLARLAGLDLLVTLGFGLVRVPWGELSPFHSSWSLGIWTLCVLVAAIRVALALHERDFVERPVRRRLSSN